MNDNRNRYSEHARLEAVHKYVEGWPIPRITEVYGLSRTSLRYWLTKMDVPRRPPVKPKKPAPIPLTLARKGPPRREIKMSDLPSVARLSDYERIIAIAQASTPT
jgi:transposase-like protein